MPEQVQTQAQTDIVPEVITTPVTTPDVNTQKEPIKLNVGLHKIVNQYKNQEPIKIINPPTQTQEPIQTQEKPKFDYSFFTDINDEDKKGVENFLKESNIDNEAVKHRMLEKLNDAKKHQRLSEERFTKIKELETKVPENVDERIAKFESFVNELKTNPVEAFKKYKADFDLPDDVYLEKQLSTGGDVNSILSEWQTKELIPNIEKKFKIEDGTFIYDHSEAYQVGTPSYEYRKMTEQKEREVESTIIAEQTKVREIGTKIADHAKLELAEIKKTYFPDEAFANSEEALAETTRYLNEIDTMYDEFSKGDLSKNPTSIKVVFRGVHFDKLAKKMVDEAVGKLHQEYQAKGVYLPNKDLPSDVTKISGINPPPVNTEEIERKKKFSPLYRNLTR